MAALKRDSGSCDAKQASATTSPLARVGREFAELVLSFEKGLLLSLDDATISTHRGHVRREACRLAAAELSTRYTRKYIRRSLDQAECQGKRVEEQLHHHAPTLDGGAGHDEHLGSLYNGHFRLFSTELFDLLGQPTELRLGTLRFHRRSPGAPDAASPHPAQSPWVTVELALNHSFFVADSCETLPYHIFRLPSAPSLQNRGILSRKPQDCGAFPDFDSWLLFTFLGNGSIKLEVPIEMCADVYGGRLRGRENQEVLFWGVFVDDDVE